MEGVSGARSAAARRRFWRCRVSTVLLVLMCSGCAPLRFHRAAAQEDAAARALERRATQALRQFEQGALTGGQLIPYATELNAFIRAARRKHPELVSLFGELDRQITASFQHSASAPTYSISSGAPAVELYYMELPARPPVPAVTVPPPSVTTPRVINSATRGYEPGRARRRLEQMLAEALRTGDGLRAAALRDQLRRLDARTVTTAPPPAPVPPAPSPAPAPPAGTSSSPVPSLPGTGTHLPWILTSGPVPGAAESGYLAVWVFLGLGVLLLLLMLAIAVFVPRPTSFQNTVFRATLAMALASIAGALQGFTSAGSEPRESWAGSGVGALGVFVLVYLIDPVRRMRRPQRPATDAPQPEPAPPAANPAAALPVAAIVADAGSALNRAVFFSYRRSAVRDMTGRIHDDLVEELGEGVVFKDVDNIPLGDDYRTHLTNALAACRVVVVILGPDWESMTESGTGLRRLDDERDYVRNELATALTRQIPIIPVLIERDRLPEAEALPADIRDVVYRQGVRIRSDPDFRSDFGLLLKGIRVILEGSALAAAPGSSAPSPAPGGSSRP